MAKNLIPYTKAYPGDTETPITIYRKLAGDGIGILLESCEQPKGRYSFIATDPMAVLRAKGNRVVIERKGALSIHEGRILDIAGKFMSEFQVKNTTEIPFTGGLVGTVGYDIIRQYEKLPDTKMDELGLPDVHLLAITELIAYDHFYHRIIFIVLAEESNEGKQYAKKRLEEMKDVLERTVGIPDSIHEKTLHRIEVQSNMSCQEFMRMVEKAKRYICEGDIFQVVLSQRWKLTTDQKPFTLYRKLRQVNPSAYMFYMNFGDYQVTGSSPELLTEVRKNKVFTCPIAGTRRRGKNEEEDIILAKELLADEKEQAEHVMLVDLGRNDMGKISSFGSVNVKKFMEVKYYSHVMHLVSLVEGERRGELDMFSVLSSFLPAGTLSGAPKIRAMEIIEELEPAKRGIYGGAAGYFGFNGDMDMCIAIRTMIIRDGKVYLQAGAGIVADSVPENEFEETVNKIKALVRAVEGDQQ